MMKIVLKSALYFLLACALAYGIFFAWTWLITFHPARLQKEKVRCTGPAPTLQPGQQIKVLSWNVQYMAGKGYYFFYEGGRDKRPSADSIQQTLESVADIIIAEDPDIVLLQEVDTGAKRTGYRNQVHDLLALLPDKYRCRTSAWYWKADFVPHPAIFGPVGMRLVTLSKYRISQATRHQLPLIPEGPLRRQYNLKRAVLEVRLPVADGRAFAALNTHLSAFAQGTDTMEKQVAEVKNLLDSLSAENIFWIAGGDFNLLPPGKAYGRLPQKAKQAYRPQTEIKPLFNAYRAVPGLEALNSENPAPWYTHFPNDPAIDQPDKTIDYIFYADDIKVVSRKVRQADTWSISDHLPVIAEFQLPKGPRK
ncbi:MAG: endonuclease/exonuclease/phosphatase family protein [Desulfobacterales bacterium]